MKTKILVAGREFTFIGERPYIRKDGSHSAIENWEGRCQHPGCQATFSVAVPRGATPETTKGFGSIHCQDHKLTRAESLARCREAKRLKRMP